jgi:GTP cyclohydrolase IB
MIENQTEKNLKPSMPDISAEKLTSGAISEALDWVGMSGIEAPVLLKDSQGQSYRAAAKVNAFVNLKDKTARGIHMSRLFREIQDSLGSKPLQTQLIRSILKNFLQTHEGLSDAAKIEIEFDALILRQSLRSQNQGWRTYPVKYSGELKGNKLKLFLETQVLYSSTCPASAALSRQLIQENFKSQFQNQDLDFAVVHKFLGSTDGIVATPHAQRSLALVKIEIIEDLDSGIENLINGIEDALQTPVQTAVKREDEQEFALRNGQNLMFCEDAARRIQSALMRDEAVLSYDITVKHLESLHPHDAVASVHGSKN